MTIDPAARAMLAIGCQQAVYRFFAALDAGDMEAVAGTFGDDGVWHRQGAQLRGRAGVAAAMAARPSGRTTAHLVQNVVAEFDDERNAHVHYLVLTYRHDAPDGAPRPSTAPMVAPYSIAAYDDRMRLDGDAWRVVERRSQNIFINP